jgi:gas vesicle protein
LNILSITILEDDKIDSNSINRALTTYNSIKRKLDNFIIYNLDMDEIKSTVDDIAEINVNIDQLIEQSAADDYTKFIDYFMNLFSNIKFKTLLQTLIEAHVETSKLGMRDKAGMFQIALGLTGAVATGFATGGVVGAIPALLATGISTVQTVGSTSHARQELINQTALRIITSLAGSEPIDIPKIQSMYDTPQFKEFMDGMNSHIKSTVTQFSDHKKEMTEERTKHMDKRVKLLLGNIVSNITTFTPKPDKLYVFG